MIAPVAPLNPELRRAILVDLFHAADPFVRGARKQDFEVRHQASIEVLDALVQASEICERQGYFLPTLLALTTLDEESVLSFLTDCESVYDAMRHRYLKFQAAPVSIDEMAKNAGISSNRFRRAFSMLKENIPLLAGSQGVIEDEAYTFAPSDHFLRRPSLRQSIEQLQQFHAAFGLYERPASASE